MYFTIQFPAFHFIAAEFLLQQLSQLETGIMWEVHFHWWTLNRIPIWWVGASLLQQICTNDSLPLTTSLFLCSVAVFCLWFASFVAYRSINHCAVYAVYRCFLTVIVVWKLKFIYSWNGWNDFKAIGITWRCWVYFGTTFPSQSIIAS